MKRFHHTSSLHYLLLQILFLASAIVASAQEIAFSPSDGSREYWYVIRFYRNNLNFAMKCDNGIMKVGSYSRSSSAAEAGDEFKWKLVESGTAGEYYMYSKTGSYVSFANSRYELVSDKADATLVHPQSTKNTEFGAGWEIQRQGGTQCMNAYQGVSENHEIQEWNLGDAGNVLLFDLAEVNDQNAEMYLQFSARGHWALYDEGGESTAPVAKIPDDGANRPGDSGYKWKKIKKDGGYILHSGNDRYIKVDGNVIGYTTSEADATVFTTPLNPYTCDVNGTGNRIVNRYQYTVDGKAIAMNGDGSLTLVSTTTPSRATVIRETLEIDGAEWPVNSDGTNPIGYSIRFPNKEGYRLAVADDGHAYATYGATPFSYERMRWTWEDAGEDLIILKNFSGEYLSKSGTGFAATTNAADAAKFRFAEFGDTGADRDKWVLHYVGATDANQYLRPSEDNNSLTLTTAVTVSKACVNFTGLSTSVLLPQGADHTLQQIFYSTAEHDYWYVIRFQRDNNYAIRCESDVLYSRAYAKENPGSDAPDNMKWKFIPSDEGGWYYMVSKTGMYVKFEDNRFRPTTQKTEATKVHLINNTANGDYPYAWQIQRQGSTLSMNPWGGVANNSIGEHNTTDGGNALLFEFLEVDNKSKDVFLQFSSYGRWAMYDDGTSDAPVVRQPVDGVTSPTEEGYLWTKTWTGEGRYTLRSDKGRYISVVDDAVAMTANAADAAVFTVSLNSYTCDVNGTGGYPVIRYQYTTANGKVLSIDLENNRVALMDAPADPSRVTVIRETQEIDGVEPPVVCGETSPVWYNIQFPNSNAYLRLGDRNEKPAYVGDVDPVFESSRIWCLEKAEDGTDLFRIRNHSGDYLKWGGEYFCAASAKADAGLFRLNEYADMGADRDKWVFHYVGATTVKQYVRPRDNKNFVELTEATSLRMAAVSFQTPVNTSSFFEHTPQQVYYSSAEDATPQRDYWYVIRFCRNRNFAIRCDESMLTGGNPDAGAADNSKWKFVPSDEDGWYYMVCKNGKYVRFNEGNSRFVPEPDKANATKVHLIYNLNNEYLHAWQIQRKGSDRGMNPVGGVGGGTERPMGDDQTGDAGNALLFDLVEEGETNVFLQFSSYGRMALYDAGAGNAPVSQTPASGETFPADAGYMWTKIAQTGGGFTLRSGNGNYMAISDGSLVMTTDAGQAATITQAPHPYTLDVNGVEGYSVERYMYIVNGKAIAVDPSNGSITLTDAAVAARSSILRETLEIDSGEVPVVSDGVTSTWYNIKFTETDDYLTSGSDGNRNAFVGQGDQSVNTAMIWSLEKAETGTDLFYLKNRGGGYLRWDITNSCFTTTDVATDKTSAALFRLAEYAETGVNRDKWLLHYVGTENLNPLMQYMLPADDKSNIGLTPSSVLRKAHLVFEKREAADADFCTEDGNDWRFLYFYDPEISLDQVIRAEESGVQAGNPALESECMWKNIGEKDAFILQNANGNYLKVNEAGDGFVYTTNKEEAVAFALKPGTGSSGLLKTWLFTCQVEGTTKVLRKDADGSIVLVDESEAGEGESIILGDKQLFKAFVPTTGEYYTIGGSIGDCLNDGLEDVYDAVVTQPGTILGGGKAIANDFLWTFIEQEAHGTYKLKNRNGNYIVWNTQGDNTFSVTTDESLATSFRAAYSYAELNNNGENAKPYLAVAGGHNITDVEKGMTMNFAKGNVLLADGQVGLVIAHFPLYEPEDYKDYKVLPKRSWFIKLSEGQKETSNSFIHHTEDGSYGLKSFTLADGTVVRRQNANDYRIVRYMKRNTMRELRLPTSLYTGGTTETRLKTYQRWYDYNTDGIIPDSLVLLNKASSRNYSNGTVMGSVMNLNGQTSGNYVGFGFNFKMPDNVTNDFEYTVGVDMSFYTDFVQYYEDQPGLPVHGTEVSNSDVDIPVDADLIEPTLAGRCIYVVRNAHIMAKQLTALPESQTKWLEEYNVAFPARKVNFKDCALPLDNEFANYWIYKDGVESEENLLQLKKYANLEFKVANNTAGITVDTYPIVQGATGSAGADADLSLLRFFRFKYPQTDGKEVVPDGSSADIEVYAKDGGKRYRLAVYHLTFEDGTELRPYQDIIGMKDDGTGHLVPKSARSPRQLRRDIGEPKAHITFDFNEYEPYMAPPKGSNIAANKNSSAGEVMTNTYRYPLRYENTSYVFEPTYYDKPGWGNTLQENAFGSYTIAKTARFSWKPRARFYPVRKYYQDAYPEEDYKYDNAGFLYIDASECPGRIASLDFDGNICKGTRITVSAWVSSPNSPDESGELGDPNAAYANVFFNILGYYTENGVEKEEKVYTYCPGPISGSALSVDGVTKYKSEPDKDGVWQQVYFTFIPRTEHIIERFVLNVNNACTNSAGGDIFIDDIEVYAATPTVKVTNTLPVCNSSLTLTKMEIDYETMLNSMGLEEEELAKFRPSVNYCVVDSALYQSKLKDLIAAGDPSPANNAMRFAAVGNIRRVSINTTFDKLPVYEYAKAAEASGPTVWSFTDENNMKQIVVSDKIISERMRPNKAYYLAAYFTYSNETIDFSAFQVGTECSISTLFTTRSSFNFIIDGEEDLANGGDATVCAGSNVTVSAKFCGVNAATGEEVLRILPCDWWLGYYGKDYARAYINADGSYVLDAERPEGAVTVSEALTNFRYFYPDALFTDACQPASVSGYTLTQAMIDGLGALSRPVSGDKARPALLLLYHRNINLQIPDNLKPNEEYIVTLQPIDNMTDVDEEFKNSILCFEADTLSIRVNGIAPGLLNGFGNVKYPDYMSNVPLRLTLQELDDIRISGLRVPLRSIEPRTEEATGLEPIELVGSDGTTYSPVYISETSDPGCTIFTDDGGLVEVGRITGMSADKGATEGNVDITFLESFTPREGYTYTLRANYREAVPAGVERNTCNGSFVFDLKVVPRYAVWTAAAGNAEWTNDLNWRRADRTDLKFDETTETDYPTNEANTTAKAFAPLAGTSVIVAAEAPYQPVLYGDKVNDANGLLQFTGHETEVTQDITYDLIVDASAASGQPYACSRFRTNRCDGLVLQAGAELLQAQHLTYNKAWAEYELAPGRWYTLGTPLQQIYAGDWYAPKTDGRESAPYFYGINFNTGNNDRFSPAVYQRGWDKGTALLYFLDDPTVSTSASGNIKNTNVAVLADWSSVYNDVNVCYDNAGFSLKAEHSGNGKLLFRLPKEDKAYDYYLDGKPENGSNHTTVVRNEKQQHKLWTDKLKDAMEFTCSLKNKRAENLYYLASNPFPCGLDMDKFFEKNKEILEQKYWLFTANGQSAAIKDPSSPNWISVNADDATDHPVLASGQGFFVKLREGKTSCELTYNADMMAGHGERTSLLRTPATRAAAPRTEIPGLHIRAERDGQASEAVIVEDDNATDGYSSAEDMETLLDESLAATPTVYTLAGNRATTVNRRRSIYSVGLGVTGRSSDEVKLTFSGMNNLWEELSLLDALTGELTPLSTGADNVSVTVPGRTANRFFLVSSVDDKHMDEDADGTVSITTHRGEVTVTATGSLQLEEVYAIAPDGRVFHSATPGASVYKFRLASGIYLISTRTVLGTVTRKVVVE